MYRRLVARVAALLMGLAAGAVAVVALPQPAHAAACNTYAHVYYIKGGLSVKWEWDDVNGPTYDFHVYYNTTVTFELGGNGIEPGSTPIWNVYDQSNTLLDQRAGSTASGNCVSNQLSYFTSGAPGAVYTYKATYEKGYNDGNVVNQNVFRLIFDVAPPTGGGGDPDPDPCGSTRICPDLPLEY